MRFGASGCVTLRVTPPRIRLRECKLKKDYLNKKTPRQSGTSSELLLHMADELLHFGLQLAPDLLHALDAVAFDLMIQIGQLDLEQIVDLICELLDCLFIIF